MYVLPSVALSYECHQVPVLYGLNDSTSVVWSVPQLKLVRQALLRGVGQTLILKGNFTHPFLSLFACGVSISTHLRDWNPLAMHRNTDRVICWSGNNGVNGVKGELS